MQSDVNRNRKSGWSNYSIHLTHSTTIHLRRHPQSQLDVYVVSSFYVSFFGNSLQSQYLQAPYERVMGIQRKCTHKNACCHEGLSSVQFMPHSCWSLVGRPTPCAILTASCNAGFVDLSVLLPWLWVYRIKRDRFGFELKHNKLYHGVRNPFFEIITFLSASRSFCSVTVSQQSPVVNTKSVT